MFAPRVCRLPGQRVLVVEDVDYHRRIGARSDRSSAELRGPSGRVGVLVDRSSGKADFGVKTKAVLSLDIESGRPKSVLCAEGKLPVIKPGSRSL